MELLPPQQLPAVPILSFGIFDLALPNLIMVGALFLIFLFAIFSRLPIWIETDVEEIEAG